MSIKAIKHTEADLLRRLAERYAPPAYAFLSHVPDATGWRKGRTLDALVMSLWPSRGLHLHGFEIKVSRGDWQRELKDPAKADGFALSCHAFWLVAPKDVVQPGELPPSWGLLVPNGTGLRAEKEPVIQEAPPPSWERLAGILRRQAERSVESIPRSELATELAAAREKGREEAEKFDGNLIVRERDQLEKTIKDFEAASGLRLNQWDAGRIGEAVKKYMQGASVLQQGQIGLLRQRVVSILSAIDAVDEACSVSGRQV